MAGGVKQEQSHGRHEGQYPHRRARRRPPMDSNWVEVRNINSHAAFMGYLSSAVTGLGFLVFTWTTVVLLGGFVSMLKKKDFWCLTVITLVQTKQAFEVILGESISNSGHSYMALLSSALSIEPPHELSIALMGAYIVARAVMAVVRSLVFITVLFPIVIIYTCGLYISTGISLWRLVQHDYGEADGDISKANLKPAMDTLYLVALVQGLLFFYRLTYVSAGRKIVKKVAEEYEFGDQAQTSVRNYLRETRIGCEKDPSFANGRNLVTYAVGLMKSESSGCFLSGARILGTLLWQPTLSGQLALIKQLLIGSSASSSHHLLQKLLRALDSRSPYDRETREHAARIVAHLAGDIRLEQFPRGIQCISSLIETFEEYRLLEPYLQRGWLVERYEQDWNQEAPYLLSSDSDEYYLENAYKELLLQGLLILRKLAADENNCRVMSNAKGLLPKIMAPVTSDLLHNIDHGAWSDIVEKSLKVMRQLGSAPGETGRKLRREISSNKEAISTMERILKCDQCDAELQKQAMGILTQLSMETLSENKKLSMDSKSRKEFIQMLVDIFTDDNKYNTRMLAGEALAMLSFEGGIHATIILQVTGDFVGSLSKILLNAKNKTYRIRAAEILQHLCSHYTKDDDCLKKLKKAMTQVMPKVLSEILPPETAQTGTVADGPSFSSPHADIEGQNGVASKDIGHHKSSSSRQKNDERNEDRKLLAALLSLCVTICNMFISGDQDLALEFDTASFPRKLREMVAKNCETTASCLRIMKLTSRMVISMMKHQSRYLKQDLDSLMEALSSASKIMFILDGSMVLALCDDGETTTKPMRTLASLVKEAQEIVAASKELELEVMVPHSSVSGGRLHRLSSGLVV